MRIEAFIFHFTDVFFSELVKETILVENWEGSDFDVRYRDYIKAFAEVKQRCCAGGISDKTVFDTLSALRTTTAKNFNTAMKKRFIEELKIHGVKVSNYDAIIPHDCFCKDSIKVDCIKTFRNFTKTLTSEHQA
ncbi:MAG: hypothetical protein LBD20_09485 [Spirochaetaceae bacterium]|jgi:pyruvate carboxylase|nr:hypothetical protein [Spirochaetaceae bacterium]